MEDGRADSPPSPLSGEIEALSAVTLLTRDLPRAMRFYESLGFRLRSGDAQSRLVSYRAGESCLNLLADGAGPAGPMWGRVIFHVADVDRMYARALQLGLAPEAPPRDAPWGERFFHLRDPDGHELSFAKPIPAG